ncbi:MAG: hypothetical protein ACOCVM_02025 [Desulfovibrionaceae bacterium]
MSEPRKPITPVKPKSMEVVYIYPCPYCEREVPQLAPFQPAMAQCDACGRTFPIVPVEESSVRFMKIMLANGQAAVDSDFL